MPITIQLPPESERRLTDLAVQTGRDVDFYLPEIVRRGLEDVEDYYLAEEIMNSESRGGVPSLEALREKYRLKEGGFNSDKSIRIHRALSWTERGQKEMGRDDPDAAFIFHWIGFDALCSEQHRHQASMEKIKKFLQEAVAEDRDASIYKLVIASESKTILTLAANAYVFKPFWNHYYKPLDSQDWAYSLTESVKRTIRNLERGERGTFGTLKILFCRLNELRNQLVHGGATWKSRVNRDQVGDAVRMMSLLLPVFLDLVMRTPDSFRDSVGSPPPCRDPQQVKDEHNDYVRRLAETTNEVERGGYREYLREAIERELAVNEDYEFVARVRDILDR